MPETPIDPLLDEIPSRYLVGIDLGTTNCAVCYIDTAKAKRRIKTLSIPQICAPAVSEARETLPSFHFQPAKGQLVDDSLRLPWNESIQGKQRENQKYCVGVMARNESARTNGRTIASAKSWLCHSGVDRTDALLPWQGADDVQKLSPMEASSRYLAHIRDAWNHQFPSERLEDQDIVLTLPASFDEVARELTIEAARAAGLPKVILIEEPQAAFYSWVDCQGDTWQEKVEAGQKILVCDIGGGTTDFTLIKVRTSQQGGADNPYQASVEFHRVAVGNHLILGGDNLDLALAKFIEAKLADQNQLRANQWELLVAASRNAKESLLGEDAPDQVTISLPSSGSKLIGGSLSTSVTQEEVRDLILDGFLPAVTLNEKPENHQSGFQEFGLPFASDPAITRHLAAFLSAHADESKEERLAARPDVVLFNGGFFDSPVLRSRVLQRLDDWFGETENSGWKPIVLESDRLDLAVARGAAYYGIVHRGEGVRIAASLARSYYIAIDEKSAGENRQAVCLVPGEAQPGQSFQLESPTFRLKLSEPVAFTLLSSSVRLTDQPGQIVEADAEQFSTLPSIRTVITARSRNEKRDVPVRLKVDLTEIGTLNISCHEVDSDRSWKLDFDVRSTVQTDLQAHSGAGESEGFIDESTWEQCEAVIASVFGEAESTTAAPKDLINRLTEILQSPRDDWPMSVLRRIWQSLMNHEAGRRKSAKHESRWLNLLGFSLRPGFGFAADDWRVTETWRTIHGKLAHGTPAIRKESLILWRRLAGGLTRGQQVSLASTVTPQVRNLRTKLNGKKVKGVVLKPEESPEVWRLLGSLELLPADEKLLVGNLLADLLNRKPYQKIGSSIVWSLGRLGQRVPIYGNLNTLIPPEKTEPWIKRLLEIDPSSVQRAQSWLAIAQMTRMTEDRFRDIDGQLRQTVLDALQEQDAPEHLISLIKSGGKFDQESQKQIFGDSLPSGLQIF
jgi:molecular chaperone DnaK (HSP70)